MRSQRLRSLIVAFLIFSVALFAAGYYVWTVPEQEAQQVLGGRLRELRAHMRSRSKSRRSCCGASIAAASPSWATW